MTEEVKEKLLQVYREALGPIAEVYDVFVDYYGEDRVDLGNSSFNEVLKWLGTRTLGNMGITSWHTDCYDIDREDYEANGRGKNFLDYIPDLGIIDYCKNAIINYIRGTILSYDSTPGVAILVRWPKVRVTNEFDKFVDITELYAQVCVDIQGRIIRRFWLTRTEYDLTQWIGGYTHSHVPSFYPSEGAPLFRKPCTGSGPINSTINTLKHNYDLDIWGLFVYELDKYVGVESIAGTPHYRLENINRGAVVDDKVLMIPFDSIKAYGSFGRRERITRDMMKDFIKYFLSKKCMKFCYRNGSYGLGESSVELWLAISNCFIEWYNYLYKNKQLTMDLNRLKAAGVINSYVVAGNKIYTQDRASRVNLAARFEGTDMFKFKGTMLKLHITGVQAVDNNVSYLVDPKICRVILTRVLRLVNALYGREQATDEAQGGETSPSEELYIV